MEKCELTENKDVHILIGESCQCGKYSKKEFLEMAGNDLYKIHYDKN